ncbi:MAG: zf-HC2 domain-containing protein [Candidatus Aminicenantia bacterium]
MKCLDEEFRKLLTPYLAGILNPQDKEQFEAHLLECSACREEIDLTEKLLAVIGENKEEILARLGEKAFSKESFLEKMYNFFTIRKLVSIGAALLLISVITLIYQLTQIKAPQISEHLSFQEIRGRNIEIFQPFGELNTSPKTIKWMKVKKAENYSIQIQDEEGNIVWQATSIQNYVELPFFIQEKIEIGKSYYIKIKAFSDQGDLIVGSEKIAFKVKK